MAIKYVSKHDFRLFAWYRFALAAAVLWMVWSHWFPDTVLVN